MLSVYMFQKQPMITAKVFQSGNSQAIRIPMQYRFKTKEVVLQRNLDGSLLVREKPASDEGYKNGVVELLSRKPKSKVQYPDISEFFAGSKDPIRRVFK